MSEADSFHIGLFERVTRGSLLTAVGLTLGALLSGPKQALGAALGSAIGLLLFSLHRGLGSRMLRPQQKLVGLIGCWALWAAKWPVVGAILYLTLRSGMVSPGWLCIGVSIVPAVSVALAVRALAVDAWRALEASR